MNNRLFEKLVESMEQHGKIARGERTPSREFHVDALVVKEIRALLRAIKNDPKAVLKALAV